MKNSFNTRKYNKNLVRRCLWTGVQNTKQGIAAATGLSVATCNTMLNEMEIDGEVFGEKKQMNGIGRSTTIYHVNEDFENFLCIILYASDGKEYVSYSVLSLTGQVLHEDLKESDIITTELFLSVIEEEIRKYPNISYVIIGTSGYSDGADVNYSDMKDLDSQMLRDLITSHYQVQVHIEHSAHIIAYGYYRSFDIDDEIVTVGCFMKGRKPGITTIYEGKLIKGVTQFAGAMDFYPFGQPQGSFTDWSRNSVQAFNIVSTSLVCDIVLLNPKRILLLTTINQESDFHERLIQRLKLTIPERFIPEIEYSGDIDLYYQKGLYQRALDLKLEE